MPHTPHPTTTTIPMSVKLRSFVDRLSVTSCPCQKRKKNRWSFCFTSTLTYQPFNVAFDLKFCFILLILKEEILYGLLFQIESHFYGRWTEGKSVH